MARADGGRPAPLPSAAASRLHGARGVTLALTDISDDRRRARSITRAAGARPQYGDLGRTYVPPRTPAERQLATLWAQVLAHRARRRDRQLLRARWRFHPEHPDHLARAARARVCTTRRASSFSTRRSRSSRPWRGTARPIVAEQGPVVGSVPLTPIQHWFFEQALVDPHHYNQSVLLASAMEDVDPSAPRAGVRASRRYARCAPAAVYVARRAHSAGRTRHQASVAFSRVDLRQTPAGRSARRARARGQRVPGEPRPAARSDRTGAVTSISATRAAC